MTTPDDALGYVRFIRPGMDAPSRWIPFTWGELDNVMRNGCKHFGDPTKILGGPVIPRRPESQREARE